MRSAEMYAGVAIVGAIDCDYTAAAYLLEDLTAPEALSGQSFHSDFKTSLADLDASTFGSVLLSPHAACALKHPVQAAALPGHV